MIRFETPAGGSIAVYYNYAMRAVIAGQLGKVPGDAAGAASRRPLGGMVKLTGGSGRSGNIPNSAAFGY